MKYQDSEGVEIAKQQMIAEKDVDAMSEIFDMFGDSTRLKIMNALFAHELCVSDLASLLEMSTSAISHQLANLKKTKLVRTRKIGKMVYYSMADEHIENIHQDLKKTIENINLTAAVAGGSGRDGLDNRYKNAMTLLNQGNISAAKAEFTGIRNDFMWSCKGYYGLILCEKKKNSYTNSSQTVDKVYKNILLNSLFFEFIF